MDIEMFNKNIIFYYRINLNILINFRGHIKYKTV